MKTLIACTIAAWPLLVSMAPFSSASPDVTMTWDEKEKEKQ